MEWVKEIAFEWDDPRPEPEYVGLNDGGKQRVRLRLRSDGMAYYMAERPKAIPELEAIVQEHREWRWAKFLEEDPQNPPVTEEVFVANAEERRLKAGAVYL
jgi:hypothetical protein